MEMQKLKDHKKSLYAYTRCFPPRRLRRGDVKTETHFPLLIKRYRRP